MFDDVFKKMQEEMKKAMGSNFQMNMPEGFNQQGGWNADEGVYYAKGSFEDEVEYNNEIICITNVLLDNMEEMNEAMDDKDYNRAEEIRKAWIQNTPNYISQINELGAYNNDDMLQKAAIEYFQAFENLMKNGYQSLIAMRLAGKRGSSEEQAQLKANNALMQKLADKFNDVSDEFLEKHE
ncbi:MAG: hypothetical protein Q4C98_05625 [Capnocytophaga sp.]|nr:hypothetical protein [Capnocytophaga sp.]